MHRRKIWPMSIAAWIILSTADVLNTIEGGPNVPTPLHNLILSALISSIVIGWLARDGGYTDGYADGFADGAAGRQRVSRLRAVDNSKSEP